MISCSFCIRKRSSFHAHVVLDESDHCICLVSAIYYELVGGHYISTGPVKPEGFWEELGVFLDKKLNRYEIAECDFCKKKIKLPRTLYKRYKDCVSCSEEHAKIMLRHFEALSCFLFLFLAFLKYCNSNIFAGLLLFLLNHCLFS